MLYLQEQPNSQTEKLDGSVPSYVAYSFLLKSTLVKFN
jgi:hypothetical protein